MTLKRLFIQAAWTTFEGLRPNASSENARERLIEDSHGVLTTPLPSAPVRVVGRRGLP